MPARVRRAAALSIYRGGATPYVFAAPYIKTGASLLRYREEFGYAFLYGPLRPARDYRGVGRQYDYVLVWGIDTDLNAVLAQELTLRHRYGPLRLYASARGDHHRADTGRWREPGQGDKSIPRHPTRKTRRV